MNAISSASQVAARGLQRASAAFDRSVEAMSGAFDRVSISGLDPLIEATTDQSVAKLMMAASIKTMRSAQEMDDALLSLLSR